MIFYPSQYLLQASVFIVGLFTLPLALEVPSRPALPRQHNYKYQIPTRKKGGESSGILPFIPGYVRHATDRIKKKGGL